MKNIKKIIACTIVALSIAAISGINNKSVPLNAARPRLSTNLVAIDPPLPDIHFMQKQYY